MPFQLRLLGPVQLRCNDVVVELGVKKSLALLVLLERRKRLARAEACSLLWPALDESTARRNLRRELARLRDAGAADAVLAEADWLLPSLSLVSDVRAMKAALAAGQPEAALALWQGPLAHGLSLDDAPAFADWLAGEREEVQDLRQRALIASAAALERTGQPEAALVHVQTLLRDDGMQEQFHRDAMRLHAACGRREAALNQFDRCCALLKTELDLLPMQETLALADALRHSAPARPPAPIAFDGRPRIVLPDLLPFVGRAEEVLWLEAAWRSGRCLLIEGEGGVGKSRLALDFVAAHGPYALVRCRPGDAEVPYAAFTRALRALIGPGSSTPDLAELPAWVISELSRLLPELGAAPLPLRSEAERARFIEACTQGWLGLATDNFDAIVLDDWHCADAASRALLACVVERRHEGIVDGCNGPREVLVYRPDMNEAAGEALRGLRASVGAQHLLLTSLPAAAVLDLVQRLSGTEAPELFAARLGQATQGNPFFLHETLRHLMERGLLSVAADGVWSTPFDEATSDYREMDVPTSVREAVLARVQRLPAASQRVLEAAAVAVEPFAPALLAPACALSEMDTVLAIEQALAARLLREHESGGFAFAHDLVQQALDASLSPERRRLAHRRLALGAEQSGASAALIARHHEASGDARRAVAHRLLAGDQAQRLHAIAEAQRHWQAGLADGPSPSQALALHTRLMRSSSLMAKEAGRTAQTDALQALVASGELAADERIDAVIAVATHFVDNELRHEGLALLDGLPDGLHGGLSDRQQAQALDARAAALRRIGQLDEALATGHAALALPGMQGQVRADMLFTVALAEHWAGALPAAMALAEQAVRLCQQLGDESGIGQGLAMRGTMLIEMGDLAAAEEALQDAIAHCTRCGLLVRQRISLYTLSALHLEQTRLPQSLALAREGWALQPPLKPSEIQLMYRSIFVGAHLGLGELGAAWAHALPAAEEALAMQEAYFAAGIAMATLELFAVMGAFKLAAPLLAAINDSALQSVPHVAKEAWVVRAQFELRTGDPSAARHSLGRVAAGEPILDPRVRERHALIQAELALASGDPKLALALLPAADAPSVNPESRLRRLALRVQAQGRRLDLPTLAMAEAELAGTPAPHALAALYLLQALPPDRFGTELAAHVSQLGASLSAHPAQQRAFTERWMPR
ncbi:hypothetical protein BH11PSE10_BH11PSE10_10710 [soil metagenome]